MWTHPPTLLEVVAYLILICGLAALAAGGKHKK